MRYQCRARRYARGSTGVLCVAVLAVGMVACSSSSKKTSSTAASQQKASVASSAGSSSTAASGSLADVQSSITKFAQRVTTYASVKPVSGTSAVKGKTVWWVPIGSSIPSVQSIGNAMQTAFGHVGITMKTCDGKLLPTDIAACLSQARTQGADGVVTGFVDYTLDRTAFDSLVSQHIPVLIGGETPDAGKTSNSKLGFQSTRSTDDLSAELNVGSVILDSKGEAKIVYLGITDSAETEQEEATAKAYVSKNCTACTFDEVNYNTASINKLPSQVSAALLSHPSTTYVICESDLCSQPALTGIQTANFSNKVKLASCAGGLDSLQRIKAGGVQFSDIGISTVYLGWQFADGIIRMLTGHPPVSALGVVRVFQKSNVASLTLTPAVYATNGWYGTNAYQKKFLTAWGVA